MKHHMIGASSTGNFSIDILTQKYNDIAINKTISYSVCVKIKITYADLNVIDLMENMN